MDFAEFKSSRLSNFGLGAGLLLIPISTSYIALFSSEEQFLGTRIRKGGIFKAIEQAIGWHAFVTIMLLFGLWGLIYALASLWKALDAKADVKARNEHIEFHPVVHRSPISYDELSRWRLEMVSGHPVVWLHMKKPYWSWQGLFKRKTIKLEGTREQLKPLLDFFVNHPIMSRKYSK